MMVAALLLAGDLITLIPGLFGPAGLVVDSDAPLPGGGTHSAHFNSAFQVQFTQFNVSLASQIASVPLPSPAGGFTFTFDPALGVFQRSTQSFGPILTDRAETTGRHRLNVGFTAQRFGFDRLEGLDLGAVPAVFTHDGAELGGGRIDVVSTRNRIDVRVDQLTGFLSWGLTDRVDLSVAVPLLHVEMEVASHATVYRLGTASSPATHFYSEAGDPLGDERDFAAAGDATGVGDVTLRAKVLALRGARTHLALGVDGRLPTGDERNLLGTGAAGVRPFLTLSMARRVVSPHLQAAYQWNGHTLLAGDVAAGTKGDLPDQILVQGGLDVGVTSRLTLAVDAIARRIVDSPRISAATFQARDGHTELPDIAFTAATSFNQYDLAVGAKLNVGGRFLLDANVLLKLNDAGLRDRAAPLLGIEYSF